MGGGATNDYTWSTARFQLYKDVELENFETYFVRTSWSSRHAEIESKVLWFLNKNVYSFLFLKTSFLFFPTSRDGYRWLKYEPKGLKKFRKCSLPQKNPSKIVSVLVLKKEREFLPQNNASCRNMPKNIQKYFWFRISASLLIMKINFSL